MEKISVIIPVYNSEPYLRKCLDSVVNQTYRNLEILLVDDGSTDNSGRICNEYAAKDNRIKVFRKDNGGVSSARNIGLKNFTGDYLGFVDSDDWLEPDMYEILYNAINNNNVHISVVCFTRDTEDSSIVERGREEIPNKILTQKEMLLYLFRLAKYAGFYSALWNKLFKADIIRNSNLTFDKKFEISEDLWFIAKLILFDKYTGIYVNKPLYHYLQRGDSLIRSYSIERKLCTLKSLKETANLAEKSGYSDIAVWQKREHCYRASLIAETAIENNNNKLLSQMQDEMKVYLKEYIETNSEYPERIERINKLLNKTENL